MSLPTQTILLFYELRCFTQIMSIDSGLSTLHHCEEPGSTLLLKNLNSLQLIAIFLVFDWDGGRWQGQIDHSILHVV